MERRTVEDLERSIRSISRHFKEDVVIVIGSQAALVGLPWTPDGMRDTLEIDIYLARVKQWEAANPEELEASEEIAGLFGRDSNFHKTFGFFIDGVGVNTAKLPAGWKERTVFREVKSAAITVTAIAPCIEDLIVSKLAAFRDKDKNYIRSCHEAFPLDVALIKQRIAMTKEFPSDLASEVFQFLEKLPAASPKPKPKISFDIPPHPKGTHKPFFASSGLVVFIRRYDPETGHYYKLDNPLGPAMLSDATEVYAIDGKKMPKHVWEAHPDVLEAQAKYGPRLR